MDDAVYGVCIVVGMDKDFVEDVAVAVMAVGVHPRSRGSGRERRSGLDEEARQLR